MTQITLHFKNKTIIVKVVKSEHYYDEEMKAYRMKHKIMIKCDKHRHYFYFYDSVYNYRQGKYELDNYDLLYALESHVSDALFYAEYEDIEAFSQLFDTYDEKKINKAYTECKRAYEKLMQIFDCDDELYEFPNYLYEFQNYLTERMELLEKIRE